MITHSEARAWSLLGPSPVLFYIKQADAYGVAWNGVYMGHKQAIQLAGFGAFKLAPTPKAKNISLNEFLKLYMCGGLDDIVLPKNFEFNDNWSYLCRKVLQNANVQALLTKTTPSQLFEWFYVYNNKTLIEQGN